MNLRLLRERIEKRPAVELRDTLHELRDVLPAGVTLVESVEERQGLGKCILEKLVVDDVLLGQREFYLRCWQFEKLKSVPICDKPLEQFRELINDSTGGPLFDQEPAKKAVLDLLDEMQVVDVPIVETPHPYKVYYARYCQENPRAKNPEAAAAKAYWRTVIDKAEKQKRLSENKTEEEAIESFRRSFKYYLNK